MDFFKNQEKKIENTIKDDASKMTSIKGIEETIEGSVDLIQDPFDTEHRKPMFNFFGITDFTFLDLSLGFATGVYHRDVKEEWHKCLGGPLTISRDVMRLGVEFMTQDFTDIMKVITNFVLLQ